MFFAFFPAVFAQTTTNLPIIPTIHPYVNDFAGVLTQEDINSVNSIAGEIEKNTTVQVAVLTVRTTQPLTIEEYANRVFRENGIGHRDNNNGLLIVAAIDDRRWRIEVGYGLEGTINDAKAGDIGRTYLTPYFQENQYGVGLLSAVSSIGKIVQGSDDPYLISTQNNYLSSSWAWIFYLIVFFFLIFLIPLMLNTSRCPRDGTLMWGRNVDSKTVFVCKKCGYRKTKPRKRRAWFFFLGGFRGGGGGSGGFGGGSSGGGGASGGW